MIAIDTSALIAILRREPEADLFLRAISASNGVMVSSVSLLEASLVLAGRRGDVTRWAELDALVGRAGMQVIAVDAAMADAARKAFLRYGKGRHRAGLNFGDCASYALAKEREIPLLYKGNDFAATDLRAAA